MIDKEILKNEIKRLRKANGYRPLGNNDLCDAYQARGYQIACDDILKYIDSLPEPASEDLEEEITKVYKSRTDLMMTGNQFGKLIHHFTEWQKQKNLQDFMEKACEWLRLNSELTELVKDFVDDFKTYAKAMEE